MRQNRRFRRMVRTVAPDTTVAEAARVLADEGYGCLVVVDDEDRLRGLVTIRDLATRVLLAGRDPQRTRVADVMSTDLLCVEPETSFDSVLQLMRSRGLRRLPVVSAGRLVGLLTLNDVMLALAEEARDLAAAMHRDHKRLRRRRENPGDADDWRGWPPHIIRRWHYG